MKSDPNLERLKQAAREGEARSQYELALHLVRQGMAADKPEASAWLLRAAEAGLRDAKLVVQFDTLGLNGIAPADLGDVEPTKPVAHPPADRQPPGPAPRKEPRPAPPRPAGMPRRASTGSRLHDEAQRRIDAVEMEMRRLGCWTDDPPTPEQMNFSQAFAMDTMAFTQWLNWIFVPRVRQIIAEQGRFPASSNVAAQAAREFDGWDESAELLRLLSEFDAFIDRAGFSARGE